MKISFIGGGNMGEAILSALLSQKISSSGELTVSDVSQTRRDYLREKYGVSVTADNRAAAGKGEVVVFAIKPQQLAEVAAGLKGAFRSSQLVLSIIAGARMEALRRGLDHREVVRVMPNTPAQIGRGMSVWTAAPEVTEKQKEQAGAILRAMGKEIYVADEGDIDRATAVSGSGPAYLFLFAEALAEAAQETGLPYDTARELVRETLSGAAEFMRRSEKLPAELRRMVTSPGGTTAAAIAEFEQGGFTVLVKRAVAAAYRRAGELGR